MASLTIPEFYASEELAPPAWEGEIYTSLDDLPLDDQIVLISPDGDDSLLQAHSGVAIPDAQIKISPPATAVNKQGRFVPFIREVKPKPPTVGKDVIAYKRALAKAGFIKWGSSWTMTYGPYAVKAVKQFQEKNGLKADGVIGQATHAKLAYYIDNWGISLLHQVHIGTPQEHAQSLMRAAMVLTYNSRWSVHYTQGPWRMYGVRHHLRPPQFGSYEDCSSEYTWNCYVGNLKDPNNLGYDGYGFTGTIAATCPRVSVPVIGVASLYGWGAPYRHVTTVYGRRSDGIWVEHSHGSEMGPLFVSHNYRGDFGVFVTPFR